MNILLVVVYYPPEIRSASHLIQELADELKKRTHKVTVITSYPQYNLTSEMEDKIFDEFSDENGIDVLRIKTIPHNKVNFIIRGISQLAMPYIFFSKIKKYIKTNINVVLVYSPPLSLAKVGKFVKKKYGSKFILNIQDIFPQNAIDLGIMKNILIIKFFENLEKEAYRNADIITAHSKNNKYFLVEKKRIPEEKIFILHNWVDIRPYVNIKRTGLFRKKYGLQNKFIFLFAGVIGPSQNLNLIISIANNIKEKSEIIFLIVGDGMEKERLTKTAQELKLENVIFEPFVSKEKYPELVKDADVGLVCLSSKNKTPVVPGKILGYMAASIPIVAFLNKESDGHNIINDVNCGYSVVSDDIGKAVETVLKIYHEKNKLEQYGKNGFKYVTKHFEKSVCIGQLEKLF